MVLVKERLREYKLQIKNYIIIICTSHVILVESNLKAKDLARGLATGMYIVPKLVFTLNVYSTIKQNCKAGIKLNLSLDGQYLEVTDVCNTHNHEVSKVLQCF